MIRFILICVYVYLCMYSPCMGGCFIRPEKGGRSCEAGVVSDSKPHNVGAGN